MSSLTIGLIEWIRHGEILDDIVEFVNENRLFFFGILSFHREDGVYKRDLVLIGDEITIRGFVDTKMTSLTFIDAVYSPSTCCAIFKVNDSTLSRKYWQPVLEKFLRYQV